MVIFIIRYGNAMNVIHILGHVGAAGDHVDEVWQVVADDPDT